MVKEPKKNQTDTENNVSKDKTKPSDTDQPREGFAGNDKNHLLDARERPWLESTPTEENLTRSHSTIHYGNHNEYTEKELAQTEPLSDGRENSHPLLSSTPQPENSEIEAYSRSNTDALDNTIGSPSSEGTIPSDLATPSATPENQSNKAEYTNAADFEKANLRGIDKVQPTTTDTGSNTAAPSVSGGGDNATSVTVTPILMPPTVTVNSVSGNEDQAIALEIDVSSSDGSETVSVTLGGLPEGTVLSAGTDNGDGSWTLTPEQLDGLTLTPPENFGGSLDLTVTATSTDGNDSATTSDSFTVEVAPVADAPTVTVNSVSGNEDQAIALEIDVSSSDGSETVSVTLGGLPEGTVLSAGTDNGDGTWTLTPEQLDGLTLTPPEDYSGSLDLSVTATSSDGNDTATTSNSFTVEVIDSSPTVGTSENTTVDEDDLRDGGIDPASVSGNLNIDFGSDGEGSVMISGPQGITADGQPVIYSWAPNTQTLTASADGNEVFTIKIEGSAYTFNLTGNLDHPTGTGENAIDLTFNFVATDSDGSTAPGMFNVTIIDDVPTIDSPDNFVFNSSFEDYPVLNRSGWGLFDNGNYPDLPGWESSRGAIELQTDSIGGLQAQDGSMKLELESEGEYSDSHVYQDLATEGHEFFNLNFWYSPRDGGTGGEDIAANNIVNVLWNGEIIDTFTADTVGWEFKSYMVTSDPDAPTSRLEFQAADETIKDTYGGYIDNVSVTAVPTVDEDDLSNGSDGSDSTSVQGALGVELGVDATNATVSIEGLTNGLTSNGEPITYSFSGDTLTANTASGPVFTIDADVAGNSYSFNLLKAIDHPATGEDNQLIDFNITVTDSDGDSATGSYRVNIVDDTPEALDITVGTTDGNVIANSVTGADGATVTAVSYNGIETAVPTTGTVDIMADDGSVLTIAADGSYSYFEGKADGENSFTYSLVDKDGDASTSTLTIDGTGGTVTGSASGYEDTDIPLTVVFDNADNEIVNSFTVDTPTGVELVLNGRVVTVDTVFTAHDMGNIAVRPPVDSDNNFDVTVNISINDPDTDLSTTLAPLTIHVNVEAIADETTVNLSATEVALTPDTPLTESFSVTVEGSNAGYNNSYGYYLTDSNGNPTEGIILWDNVKEHTGETKTVEGVSQENVGYFIIPNGGRLSNVEDDQAVTFEFNQDGYWDVVIDGETLNITSGGGRAFFSDETLHNDEIQMTDGPAAGNQNWDDQIQAGDNDDFNDVSVNVVWETSAPPAEAGVEIAVNATFGDTGDGSERHIVTLTGVPQEWVLAENDDSGFQLVNGVYQITLDNADTSYSGTPTFEIGDWQGNVDLAAQAIATEANGNVSISPPTSASLEVTPVASPPNLNVSSVSGNEDETIALEIDVSSSDGSETVSVTLGGLPEGTVLSAGTDNGDGTWTLTPEQLDGLTLTPPEDYSGSLDLSVTATSTDGNDSATTSNSFTVEVAPVADAPTVTVNSVSGNEDQAIALEIDVSSSDGSETVSVTLGGLPEGTVLSAGTDNGDGTWTLTPEQLDGLTLTPPEDYSGSLDLSVTATSTDGNDSATTSDSFTVEVTPVADSPSLTVSLGSPILTIQGGVETQTAIDVSNYSENGDGYWVTARTVKLDGTLADPSTSAVSTHAGGLGVSGIVTGLDDKIGYDFVNDQSEELIVSFNYALDEVSFDYARAFADGDLLGIDLLDTSDNGHYDLFRGDVKVGGGSFSSAIGSGTVLAVADDGGLFDRIVFSAVGSDEKDSSLVDLGLFNSFLISNVTYPQIEGGIEVAVHELNIDSSLTDTDGSETLSITIDSLPDEAMLSSGTDNGDGTWTLASEELVGLTLSMPTNNPGEFSLNVSATAVETNGDMITASSNLLVNVDPQRESPEIKLSCQEIAHESPLEPVLIAPDITLSDANGSNIVEAVVSITDGFQIGDGFGFQGLNLVENILGETIFEGTNIELVGGLSSLSDILGASVTLRGSDSLENYQDVLNSLSYNSLIPDTISGNREISIEVTDETGLTNAPATVNVDVYDPLQSLYSTVEAVLDTTVTPVLNWLNSTDTAESDPSAGVSVEIENTEPDPTSPLDDASCTTDPAEGDESTTIEVSLFGL